MIRPVSPINNPCCTKPPNPWLAGSQGSQGQKGCVCSASCVGPQGPVKILYWPVSDPNNITVERELDHLDSMTSAFVSGVNGVNTRLNNALLMPTSTAATIAAIPSQNAAAIVNKVNAAAVIAPQEAAVAAANSSITGTTAARLAYRAACEAKAVFNSIKNINMEQLGVLVLKAKLATDALVPASIAADNAAQGVYNTAGTIQTSANDAVTASTAALTQTELAAAVASCNAIPGSANSRYITYKNNIIIADAKRELELATNAAIAAASATESCNAVAISTARAVIAANTAAANAILVNNYFTDAAAKNTAVTLAIIAYDNDITNETMRMNLHNAQNAANAANALLPPLSAINDLVSSTAQASYLANIAGANAKALSTSLDIKARAAAAPARSVITGQMIATQTAAAERFGAAAAAAASRAARASAAPPIPPPIPPPAHAPYSVRMPSGPVSESQSARQVRAERAARAMAANPRDYHVSMNPSCNN